VTQKLLASATAAEAIIVAVIIGIGSELVAPATGVLAFGLAWALPVVIDRIRRAD